MDLWMHVCMCSRVCVSVYAVIQTTIGPDSLSMIAGCHQSFITWQEKTRHADQRVGGVSAPGPDSQKCG